MKGHENERVELTIVRLEVWGLGGEKAAKIQKGQRDWEKGQIGRIRNMKRSDWDVDKQILEMVKLDFGMN